MATSIQKNLIERNKDYAETFTQGNLVLPPAKKYAVRTSNPNRTSIPSSLIPIFEPIVTCMDARIHPSSAFGIDLGDAHIIRNAGASARDALRSLIISQQLLGTNEILLIKHTGCGMLTFSNSDAHSIVKKNLGEEGVEEIGDLDFLPFEELEEAVKSDLRFLRGSHAIPSSVTLSGWVYEVESGKVRRVE